MSALVPAIVSALGRFGGVMTAPRATVAALRPDEGRRDGWVLGGLYVFAVATYAIIDSLAAVVRMHDLSAFIMLASTLGRVLVAPVLVLVAAETLLGASRSHRRALSLVPLLAVVTIASELAHAGVKVPMFAPEIVGGVLGLALTWHIRSAIEPVSDEDGDEEGAS